MILVLGTPTQQKISITGGPLRIRFSGQEGWSWQSLEGIWTINSLKDKLVLKVGDRFCMWRFPFVAVPLTRALLEFQNGAPVFLKSRVPSSAASQP